MLTGIVVDQRERVYSRTYKFKMLIYNIYMIKTGYNFELFLQTLNNDYQKYNEETASLEGGH